MTSGTRGVTSAPDREAQAAATPDAILEAFVEQLSEPGHDQLSPREAADRRACRSVRCTPTSQIARASSPHSASGSTGTSSRRASSPRRGPTNLPRYYRDIHRMALASPLTRALSLTAIKWPEIRQQRRKERLDAIRERSPRSVHRRGRQRTQPRCCSVSRVGRIVAAARPLWTTRRTHPRRHRQHRRADRRTAPIATRGEAAAAARLVILAPDARPGTRWVGARIGNRRAVSRRCWFE